MTKKKAANEQPKYEDIRSRLEEVVAKLERGEGTLEESLALYEEGVKLVRAAHGILDAAERRLEALKPQADGSFRLEKSDLTRLSAGRGAGGPGEEQGPGAGGEE
jgi:exodeoxyribonuclease VII small subunit